MASLDENSYLALAQKHFSAKELGMNFDQWVRELVNLGVPGVSLLQSPLQESIIPSLSPKARP